MDFYLFDAEYVRRLCAGEAEVEEHFAIYFAARLRLKLRAAKYTASVIDDIIQDTLLRTLVKLCKGELRQAESLGAFVFSICKNICLERSRQKKLESLPDDLSQIAQSGDNQERDLLQSERSRVLKEALAELSDDDRQLLIAAFYLDRRNPELSTDFGVSQNYIRVRLHRAKKTLKRHYLAKFDGKNNKPETADKEN